MGWGLFLPPLVFFLFHPGESLARGWAIPVLHVLHLSLTGSLVTLFYAVGRFLLRRSGLFPSDGLEKILLGTCSGFLAVSFAMFLLAAMGILWAVSVGVLVVAACACASRGGEEADFPSLGSEAGEGEDGDGRAARTGAWALGLLLSLLLLGSLTEALYPSPQSPDSLAYNLVYARQFSRAGEIVFSPESPLFFSIIGYWEFMLAGLALFVRSDVSLLVMAQVLHLVLGLGLTSLAIICLVRRLGGAANWTWLALGIFGALMFAGMRLDVYHVRRFPFLVYAPKSDLVVSALQVGATLLFVRASIDPGISPRRLVFLAGLLLGGAAGVKITGGVAIVGIGAAFFLMPGRTLFPGARLKMMKWLAAGAFFAILPMLLKNLVPIGNPVYPLLASRIGGFQNPVYFSYIWGFFQERGDWADWAGRTIGLLFPSAPFFLLLGAAFKRWTAKETYAVLLCVILSIMVFTILIPGAFFIRYGIYIIALAAACAASIAGGAMRFFEERRTGWGPPNSPYLLPAAWTMVFVLAILPAHLDNRLKRAVRTASAERDFRERTFRMSPASGFQARWAGHLPEGARPLTFYRPEKLFAVSKGWFPTTVIESPEMARLFARRLSGPELERALAGRGITHVYFESRTPVPAKFPLRPDELVAHLRGRPPVMRADGFEMYALRSRAEN